MLTYSSCRVNKSQLINACVWKCDADVDKADISLLYLMEKKKQPSRDPFPIISQRLIFIVIKTMKVTKVV